MDLLCYGLQQKLLRNLIFLGIIVLQMIFVPAVFTSREEVRLLWVFNHATIYFLVEALFLSNFYCCCWEDDFLSFLYIRQGTFFSSIKKKSMILESFHATGRLCIDQTTHWMLYGHCTDVASSFLVYKRFVLQRNLFLKSIIWYSKVWLFFTDSVIIIRATLRAFWWWKQKPSQFEIHIWHCFYSCIRKDGADISLTKPFAPRFFLVHV